MSNASFMEKLLEGVEVEWKALGEVYKFQYGTGNTIPTLGGEYPVYGSNGIVCLKKFFFTGNKKGINPEHATRLERILDRLNAADDIRDMNYPGSNLHELTGDKQDQHAVNVSGNWRVFFDFINGHTYVVDYDDYH